MTQPRPRRSAAALQQAYAYYTALAKPAPATPEVRLGAIEQMYAYFG